MTEGPRHDDGRPRSCETVARLPDCLDRADLGGPGWSVVCRLYRRDRARAEGSVQTVLQIENRTDQTVMVYRVIEGYSEGAWLTTIRPHDSVSTGDDCGSTEMIATTSDGTEIARRGPFKSCNLDTWVIRDVSRPSGNPGDACCSSEHPGPRDWGLMAPSPGDRIAGAFGTLLWFGAAVWIAFLDLVSVGRHCSLCLH
jgi:hypothetical protein